MLRFMGSQRVGHDAVRSLGSEDPLGEDMATHSSILCLKNSMDRGAWQAAVHSIAQSDMTKATEHTAYFIHTHTHTHTPDHFDEHLKLTWNCK